MKFGIFSKIYTHTTFIDGAQMSGLGKVFAFLRFELFGYAISKRSNTISLPPAITAVLLDNAVDYTIAELSQNTALESFIAIDTVITGDIGLINIASLQILNFGDQRGNSSFIGNPGLCLGSCPQLITLAIIGGNTTYSAQTYSSIANGLDIYLKDTEWSNAKVDQLFIDLAPFAANINSIRVVGKTGYPTSVSSAARTTLANAGVELMFNGVLLTSMTYLNDDQDYEDGTAIINLLPTVTADDATTPTTDIHFEAWGLPNGVSINSTTGIISASNLSDARINFEFVVRASGYDTYSGFVEYQGVIDNTTGLAPVNFVVIQNGDGFDTSWEIPVGAVEADYQGWQLLRSIANADDYQLVGYLDETITSWHDDGGLVDGTAYDYGIRGREAGIGSGYTGVAYHDEVTYNEPSASTTVFNFNLGSTSFADAATWNTTNISTENTTIIPTVVDVDNNASGLSLYTPSNNHPVGKSTSGGYSQALGDFPSDASISYFYVDDSRVGKLEVRGLNDAKTYDFEFLCARNSNGADRSADITIGATTVTIDGANAPSSDSINGVSPSSGTIIITYATAVSPNAAYAYLNAFILTQHD